jgi:hypothetical protein
VDQAEARAIWYCFEEEPVLEASTASKAQDGTECFDDYLPYQKDDCDIHSACVKLAENIIRIWLPADRMQFIMFLTGGDAKVNRACQYYKIFIIYYF